MRKNNFKVFLALLTVPFALTLTSSEGFARKQIQEDDSVDTVEKSQVPFKEAESGVEMRKIRRFGVGLQAAGSLGLGGAILDLNFTPNWSFGAGFGGGEGFQSFMFQGRYVLAGDWLMPYLAFGYTNWASTGKGTITKSTPSYLADKILTGDERQSGQFQKNLFFPSFGLQFMQLHGDWAGFSLFGEISAMLDLTQFVAAPTGSLGVLYYF